MPLSLPPAPVSAFARRSRAMRQTMYRMIGTMAKKLRPKTISPVGMASPIVLISADMTVNSSADAILRETPRTGFTIRPR